METPGTGLIHPQDPLSCTAISEIQTASLQVLPARTSFYTSTQVLLASTLGNSGLINQLAIVFSASFPFRNGVDAEDAATAEVDPADANMEIQRNLFNHF